MSHLDEGTLHAMLDGELGGSEMRQIEAHLGHCTACGTRLDEVKSVRAEADGLIGSLGSPEVPTHVGPVTRRPRTLTGPTPAENWHEPVLLIPEPLESDLQHRRRKRMIGWAAALLVAVGAGGYLGLQKRAEYSQIATSAAAPLQRTSADSAVLAPQEAVSTPQRAAAPVPSPDSSMSAKLDTAASKPGPTSALATDGGAATARTTAKKAEPPASRGTAPTLPPRKDNAIAAEAAAELAKLRQSRTADGPQQLAESMPRSTQPPAPTPTPPPAPAPPAPATLEERAQIYMRIGLDEAKRQLGSPMHGIEGMSPTLIGLAQGRVSPGMDTTRPVVRAVYVDPMNRLIMLDQQRLRPGQSAGVATQLRSVIDDVVVGLHGEPPPNVLRNLAARIQ